jgi:adenosylmethionine-8-amino-7-oxononanoate aminotransferase
VLGRGLRDGVAIAPPLIIDDATTEEMTERLGRALDRLR